MKSCIRLFLNCLPIVVVLLILVEITITNELVHFGKSVQAIDIKIDTIQQENEQIAQRIASASSLVAIEQKATAMGFLPAASPLVLGPEEFAFRPGH
jgi:hypothetical protein